MDVSLVAGIELTREELNKAPHLSPFLREALSFSHPQGFCAPHGKLP